MVQGGHPSAFPILMTHGPDGQYKAVRNLCAVTIASPLIGLKPNLIGLNYIDQIFLFLNSQRGREIAGLTLVVKHEKAHAMRTSDAGSILVPSTDTFDQIPTHLIRRQYGIS